MNIWLKEKLLRTSPFWVLAAVGLVFCSIEILILLREPDRGGLGTGLLSMAWCLFFGIYVFDKYLRKKYPFRNVVIGESILVVIVPFFFLYTNRKTEIRVGTSKPYFVVLYDKRGLTKEQIPSSGIFGHAITFNYDEPIVLEYSLSEDRDVRIIGPKAWGGHFSKCFDTVVNNKSIGFQLFSHDVDENYRDSIFMHTRDSIMKANVVQ